MVINLKNRWSFSFISIYRSFSFSLSPSLLLNHVPVQSFNLLCQPVAPMPHCPKAGFMPDITSLVHKSGFWLLNTKKWNQTKNLDSRKLLHNRITGWLSWYRGYIIGIFPLEFVPNVIGIIKTVLVQYQERLQHLGELVGLFILQVKI